MSRRLRSASDFGLILRVGSSEVSDGSERSEAGVLWEVFLRMDFGAWGCDVAILEFCGSEIIDILMFCDGLVGIDGEEARCDIKLSADDIRWCGLLWRQLWHSS
jgi:hypothetical protein